MISPLSTDLSQLIFGWHFRNFLCDERPFSLDIEGYRSRIPPEAILQRQLRPLSTDFGGFIPGQFVADSKGVPSQISGDLSKMPFLSILEATEHRIRPRLFYTDNEVY
ncbi:unnamed protein product [Linum trigynum]|uniref:Uncharacterized protein n=1 Tax=Linum trigynum TaxID=586398 RepID=A0AAV2FM41_9ROSI